MNKNLALVVAFTSVMYSVSAQKLILNTYGSYVLEGGYSSDYGYSDYLHGKSHESIQFGAGVEHPLTCTYGLELMYLRRNTQVFQQSELDPQKKMNFSVAMNYLLGGINGYLQPETKKFQAYGSMFAGLVIEEINFPDNAINNAITKFAWAIRLGGKYWVSDRVGLRLQAQWTSFFKLGNSLPPASVYGLNTGEINFPIAYQFELGTGLMVKLWKNENN